MLKSMRKSKNRHFTTFLFPLAITLNVAWIEREFDAYKLPRCICPSNYNVSEIERDMVKIMVEKRDFSSPLAFDAPVRGVPAEEYRHPLCCGKTRMVSLPDGEKKIRRYVYSF